MRIKIVSVRFSDPLAEDQAREKEAAEKTLKEIHRQERIERRRAFKAKLKIWGEQIRKRREAKEGK